MSRRKQSPIKLSEFLNTAEELHALVIGWAEIVCPWPPLHKKASTAQTGILSQELHYYQLGRVLGIPTWVGILAAIKAIFF